MIRMCRLTDNKIIQVTKDMMYDRMIYCLDKLHKAERNNEGRILSNKHSLRIFVTGKRSIVEEYGKFMYNKVVKSGYKITKDASEGINIYEMVIFDLFDCDNEQKEIMNKYIERYKGVGFVLLPYNNYSENVMSLYGDGFYLQLGNKIVNEKKEY